MNDLQDGPARGPLAGVLVVAIEQAVAPRSSRAAQKHMVDAGFGRIISISSTSALGNRGQVNYSAAKANIPVGRVGRPEDIAHVVSFLASEGAGFVSGQVIYAAGGPRS